MLVVSSKNIVLFQSYFQNCLLEEDPITNNPECNSYSITTLYHTTNNFKPQHTCVKLSTTENCTCPGSILNFNIRYISWSIIWYHLLCRWHKYLQNSFINRRQQKDLVYSWSDKNNMIFNAYKSASENPIEKSETTKDLDIVISSNFSLTTSKL